jgi:hypothetical protein
MAAPVSNQTSKASRERLSAPQRFGEVVGLLFSLLPIAYFMYSFAAGTGFFTSAFGPWEQFWFFAPMFVSLAAPLVRALVGRRNAARPFQILSNVLLAVGSWVLLVVFPFDFSHLGDALPWGLSFMLNWVPDWLGRVGLVLAIVGGTIGALSTTWRFISASRSE